MGYAEEKKKVENKAKIVKRIAFVVVAVLFLALVIVSVIFPVHTWKYRIKLPKVNARAENEMRIHFIDVGQGDATIIELPDGKIMVIDGGNGSDDSVKALLRYITALKIEKVHYLLVTHADLDHCGGLDELVEYTMVERVFLPYVNPTVNGAYAKVYQAVTQSGCDLQYISRDLSLTTESYCLQVLYPYLRDLEQKQEDGEYFTGDNETSAVVWLDYQGVSTLFTGDAPISVTKRLLMDNELGLLDGYGVELNETEILKLSHHGSQDGTDEEILDGLGVQTAVISCGKNNAYSHPSSLVYSMLTERNLDIYRTDRDGSVMVTVGENGEYAFTKIF